jgi:hypothetical protein
MRIDKYGRGTGGKPLARGALYLMLQNRIYRGKIVHKEKSYPGEHEAIIDEVLWNKVQSRLIDNRVERQSGVGAAAPSLLAGLIYDDKGERMSPTHAKKRGRRYRYYVSHSLIKRGRPKGSVSGRRIPAGDIEQLVTNRITAFLSDEAAVFGAIEPFVADLHERRSVVNQAMDLAKRWPDLGVSEMRQILHNLKPKHESNSTVPPADVEPTLDLDIRARLKRIGVETKFLIDGGGRGPRSKPDNSMLRLLAQAHRYREMLLDARGRTMLELAREAGVGRSYFCRVVKLGFLAPDVVNAILRDCHPVELTAKHLSLNSKLPLAWEDQVSTLGIV